VAAADRRGLMRPRGGAEEARVEFVELFFDLVFVFAITQLSHRLIEHPTALGAAETLILFAAIWWAWINTAWVTNWLDPHRTRVRLLLFAMMAAGLLVSMSIPEAFAERGLSFACAYVAMELGRSLFTAIALKRHDPANHLNFLRILIWQAAAAACWIAGGIADGPHRLLLWTLALAIYSAGPVSYFWVPGLGHSCAADWTIDPHHLAERCGLFIILALGESILVMGATFAELEWDAAPAAAFVGALVGTVAMWWLYFNIGAVRATHMFEASAEPGRVGRFAYTYLHAPIVAGIVIWAAAVEWGLAHPLGEAEPHVRLAAIGGPALYLAGNAAFKRATGARWWPLSHSFGLGVLALLAAASRWLTPTAIGLAVAALLLTVAIWETRSLRGQGDQS